LQVEHTLDKCYNEPKNGPASMVFVELYPVVVATFGENSGQGKRYSKKQQHIVKIFYMGILCITLKERNAKRFVQN
jgi:hypothetical protein